MGIDLNNRHDGPEINEVIVCSEDRSGTCAIKIIDGEGEEHVFRCDRSNFDRIEEAIDRVRDDGSLWDRWCPWR